MVQRSVAAILHSSLRHVTEIDFTFPLAGAGEVYIGQRPCAGGVAGRLSAFSITQARWPYLMIPIRLSYKDERAYRVKSNENRTGGAWFCQLIIIPSVRAILLSSMSVEERV